RLLLGETPPDEAAAFGVHLQQCDRCATTLQEMEVTDTLLDHIRRAARIPDLPENPQSEDSLQRIYHLVKRVTAGVDSATGVSRAGAEATANGGPPAAAESFAFLGPPQGPGEMGRLGHYHVFRVLGQGGMGIVFAAEDPHLRRQIALKVLRPRWAAEPQA